MNVEAVRVYSVSVSIMMLVLCAVGILVACSVALRLHISALGVLDMAAGMFVAVFVQLVMLEVIQVFVDS